MSHHPAFLALVACLSFGGTALAQNVGTGGAGPGATAGASGQNGATASTVADDKVVVELFTSQGCASCPPADALLTELTKDPRVIALTLPVDYWDYIGWKDTLALHGHSLRQRAYAAQRPDRKVFTPQVVVDGVRAAKGSDKAAVQRALLSARAPGAGHKVPIKLEREGNALMVELAQTEEPVPEASVWACPFSRSETVAIGRGENGGRKATYSNVVRGWVRMGSWDGQTLRLTVPLAELRRDDADMVAVLVQAGSSAQPGRILGAATLPLN